MKSVVRKVICCQNSPRIAPAEEKVDQIEMSDMTEPIEDEPISSEQNILERMLVESKELKHNCSEFAKQYQPK